MRYRRTTRWKATVLPVLAAAAVALVLGNPLPAQGAGVTYLYDFETEVGDWTGNTPVRVESGDGFLGVPSRSGDWHAEVYSAGGATYTFWDGATTSNPGVPVIQSLDVYIDTSWTAASPTNAFIVDMAPSFADGSGSHWGVSSEFLVRVGETAGEVDIRATGLGGASHFNELVASLDETGWYNFEMAFRQGTTGDADPSILHADLSVYAYDNDTPNLLGTQSRPAHPDYDQSNDSLGGTGFLWLRDFDPAVLGEGPIAIDDAYAHVVPSPAAAGAGLVLLGGLMLRRRRPHVDAA